MWNPFKKKKSHVWQPVFNGRTSDEQRVAESLINEQKCPDCESKKFYEGPSGGASTNFQCADCKSEFNISPFTAERI
ncbi:hypothetical protein LCGC14_0355960 [marine sediment metagenome]|uniref:Transposase zinc-ribbon domain-containing protein n=1 Tax=marine sediment metagenome TaxID=412755 RepID=A0A0F9TF24_9ZZZZ